LGGLFALAGGATAQVKADDQSDSEPQPEPDLAQLADDSTADPDAIAAACGTPNQPCCPGNTCRPPLVCSAVSGATGVCCPEGATAINGKCCPHNRVCGGTNGTPQI